MKLSRTPLFTALRARVLVAGLVAMAVAGGAALATSQEAKAETLRMAVPTDPSSLDPAFWLSTTDQYLINNIFPKLIRYKTSDTWEWEPGDVDKFEWIDAQTIEFSLRPGMMWTNGYGEVTAEDVEFSFERHLDEELASWNYMEFESLVDVEVTGTYSGVIKLSRPLPEFNRSPLAWVPGAIISKEATLAAGGTFSTEPPATSGPYKIQEIASGERIVLVRDENWTGAQGAYDEIHLIPIADENARVIAFEAGEIDWLHTSAGSIPALEANLPASAKMEVRETTDPLWLGMTIANPDLADIKVRKAIQMAVDVDAILQAVYAGHASRATGLIGPTLSGYRDVAPPARDVQTAKALIGEAGANGLSLQLDHVNTTEMTTAGQIVQANLAEIGLDIVLNPLDEGTFWNLNWDVGAGMQLHFVEWVGNPTPSYFVKWFTPGDFWNWEAFENEEYVALLNQALSEADEGKRSQMYQDLQAMMEDSGAFVFITQPPSVVLYRDSVRPSMYPDGHPVFNKFGMSGS